MIFHRYKKVPAATVAPVDGKPPIASTSGETYILLPPIPVYLSEEITKLFIDSESKNVDFQSDMQTYTDGSQVEQTQKGIASTITVNITAKKTDLSVILLGSFIDSLLDKVTSKEYAITYLHGATTIFLGLLHSFSIDTVAGNDLAVMKFELSKGNTQPQKAPQIGAVPARVGPIPVGG